VEVKVLLVQPELLALMVLQEQQVWKARLERLVSEQLEQLALKEMRDNLHPFSTTKPKQRSCRATQPQRI
jgi:hypothetical protein